MSILAGLAAGLAAALACLLGARALPPLYRRVRRRFEHAADDHLADAFVFVDARRLWWVSVALCAVSAGLAWLWLGHPAWVLAAGGGAVVLPRAWMRWQSVRRQRRMEAQLPAFLRTLAAALRAGAGIQSAMQRLAGSLDAPLGQELQLVLREQRMGRTQAQALSNWSLRAPLEGVQLLVCGVLLASRHGGSLADMLDRVAATVEARVRLTARVHALTAQGRLQAAIMAALPLLLALALQVMDPQAMWPLWHTPAGWRVLAVVITLEAAGILLIRRIVRIDI